MPQLGVEHEHFFPGSAEEAARRTRAGSLERRRLAAVGLAPPSAHPACRTALPRPWRRRTFPAFETTAIPERKSFAAQPENRRSGRTARRRSADAIGG